MRADGAPLLSEALNARIDRILKDAQVPGAAIAVVSRGRHQVKVSGRGITPHTAFDIGSCSKAFVATSVAMLVDEGKLGFDEPVRRWLPEIELDTAEATAQLCARDLLSNRIGFKRQVPVDALANPELSASEIVARIGRLDRAHPFRGGYVYFNPGFIAARLLVERISGLEYGEFLAQRIFAPLGMKGSASGSSRVALLKDQTCGHVLWQGQIQEIHDDLFDNWQGAAGVHTSAEDAARWLKFQLGSPAYIAETHKPQTEIPRAERKLIHAAPESERADYCLGWWTSQLHGRRLVHHAGEMFGWRAYMAFVPDEGIGVAVMLSLGAIRHHAIAYTVLETLLTGDSRDWCEVADRMAGEFNASTAKLLEMGFPAGSEPTLELERYAGRYAHPALGVVAITQNGTGLQMRFLDGHIWDQQLQPLGGHTFEARPRNASVGDYFPIPLRLRFDVRDGRVLSLTDTQARYLRKTP